MIDRVANIINSPTPNKPWALYHLLYFAYRYRFEYQYRDKNPIIGMRLPEYLMVSSAFNTTQIFLFDMTKERKSLIQKMGKDEYQFYELKLNQQLVDLDRIYHQHPHTIFGINPKTGLVHPIDFLETQQMAKNFNLIIKQFPFTLEQFQAFEKALPEEDLFSILQGIQIADRFGGTAFLIKVKNFMVMYYEVPQTEDLDKQKVHINNKNVKVNLGSKSPNIDLQTHLFNHNDEAGFLYGELRLVGKHLQKMARRKLEHK
ncbi:hypothetical protein [Acetilactobacillus jinshanensis]|uniref:Uncharacterized protein n=1 Tax=Acetilactobacillus jinshanensis TaxID=1720083 RepID=A0A4P6ZK07_9LACO|nr:hypothetical protein [Acetilactobacillus jinshanensis]QBP18085.1 hypothetical protein ELX58_02770 [Acetilactobacillus jinshanensis]URL60948.1 hypothetical protein HGK75_02810 [uncultured bacterium]